MKSYLYVALISVFSITAVNAQGCSDAGVCSIDGHYDDEVEVTKNRVEVGTVFGAGDADITYIAPYVSYTRNFNAKWATSVKITSSFASGDFGDKGSIGDAFLTANYRPQSTESMLKWSYTAGIKIPFNNADLDINGNPLPMDYQSSLGTYDFLGGVSANYRKWDFSAAIQVPVINENENRFVREGSGSTDFVTTNLFERKPDALLRGIYTITKNKFTFKPNILVIYHLGEDTYEDALGNNQSIDGSDGVTVNGNLISSYNFSSGSSIQLSIATPFVIRDERPDGLTRAWTAGVSYIASF
ncbi:MAG: hypothetical protein BM557_09060 [Flavobacterium sp. MedPE-SWcel]|uniref:hypothetical protein n=1 Tax=uncultured Flavobacterium sp. TaxID=165435 RepID=UPI000922B917|nr:hypothetical protein [uncultured Flavobacterium sp.]OIQ16890.1 MAG: hypothetical protein BM557_09060 [Flavobacterium sp. MedPE-SWcel]